MKAASAKAKGRELQKWVCQKIADIFKIKYDQQDDQCPIHSRESGQKGVDIILRGKLYNKFLFDIECKNVETLKLYKVIRQIQNNTNNTRDWLLIHKKNYSQPIVIMSWDAFEKLFKKGMKND